MIKRLLMFLLSHVTYEHHLPGYMLRYWIFLKRRKDGIQIRLHNILTSDHDRHLHDHPWWYITIILSGGYIEVTEIPDKNFGIVYKRKWYGTGSILFRKATHLHRLIVPDGTPTWTLFICGPKSRDWGFITADGWIKWDVYENRGKTTYIQEYQE